MDVYFGVGWEAYKLATKMNGLGLPIYTEFPWLMERYVTWIHTSQDWTQKIAWSASPWAVLPPLSTRCRT